MKRRHLLIFLLVLICPIFLFARPEPEEDSGGRRSLCLLVESEAADNDIYVTRFLLPSSLSLFSWADFKIRGGEVSMVVEETFRIRENELEVAESMGSTKS